MDKDKPRARVFMIAAGIGIIFISAVVFAVLIYSGVSNINRNMNRFLAPGMLIIDAEKPGKFTIFHEYISEFEGKKYDSEALPPITVTVKSLADGKLMPVKTPEVKKTYSIKNNEAASILEFDIKDSGQYEVNAAYNDGSSSPQVVLAVGANFGSSVMTLVLTGIIVLLQGLLLGGFLLIREFMRLHKHKLMSTGIPDSTGITPPDEYKLTDMEEYYNSDEKKE